MTRTANGRADTTRADRYLAQLCDHLDHMRHGAPGDHQPGGHDHDGPPDVRRVRRTENSGVIVFDWGTCTLRASPDALAVQIEAADHAALTRARALIGNRIEVIGRREHWDHVWGACAWPDVEIIGQRTGARILEAETRRPWSHQYLRDEVDANPRLAPSFRGRAWAVPSWEGFVVLPPNTEFDEAITLSGGIEVRHVGGRHAPDSTVVAVPDSGVLLLGDSLYPPPLHLREPGDGPDFALIRGLIDEGPAGGYDWYVGSHDSPYSRSALAELLRPAKQG